MKKILIIGGAGFIGYHLAKKLIRNFNAGFKENNKSQEKLDDYSNRIFKNVIEEYNKFFT